MASVDSTPRDYNVGTTNITDCQVLEGLSRLAVSLKELDDKKLVPLSHYRQLPEAVSHSYELLQQGASLIHATSTKYTLLGKIHADQKDQQQQEQSTNLMANDLLKGCQLVATGCLVFHQPNVGCAPSLRHTVKQSTRAIVQTVLLLVKSFVDGTALDQNVAAQKTGAIWQACDTIIHKQLPMGNRNAMRRQLFTFLKECNETMREFQEMVNMGPAAAEVESSQQSAQDVGDASNDHTGANTTSWEGFLSGATDQYTAKELPIASACIYVIKCSRGSINVVLKACEAVGQLLDEGGTNGEQTADDTFRLDWMSQLCEQARVVGESMTDLGATLYPPLELDAVDAQVQQQTDSILRLVELVLKQDDEAQADNGDASCSLGLEDDLRGLARKIQAAVQKRKEEAIEAINSAR